MPIKLSKDSIVFEYSDTVKSRFELTQTNKALKFNNEVRLQTEANQLIVKGGDGTTDATLKVRGLQADTGDNITLSSDLTATGKTITANRITTNFLDSASTSITLSKNLSANEKNITGAGTITTTNLKATYLSGNLLGKWTWEITELKKISSIQYHLPVNSFITWKLDPSVQNYGGPLEMTSHHGKVPLLRHLNYFETSHIGSEYGVGTHRDSVAKVMALSTARNDTDGTYHLWAYGALGDPGREGTSDKYATYIGPMSKYGTTRSEFQALGLKGAAPLKVNGNVFEEVSPLSNYTFNPLDFESANLPVSIDSQEGLVTYDNNKVTAILWSEIQNLRKRVAQLEEGSA